MSRPTPSATEQARAFVEAIAAQDASRLRGLLATSVRFRAVTPRRFWEADTAPVAVDEIVLGTWFAPDVTVHALEDVQVDAVGDLTGFRYRMRLGRDGERYVVEQSGYLHVTGDAIDDVRLVCSGFLPTL